MTPRHFDLSDRLCLITGSSQGIGLALARGLAEYGTRVVLNDRDPDKLAQAAKELRADGFDVEVAPFDVTVRDDVIAGVDKVERGLGPIEVLVNNAGMQFRAPLEDYPADRWEQLLATNVSSVFYTGQAVARHMIARGRGKIVNIASVQTELPAPASPPIPPPRAPFAT